VSALTIRRIGWAGYVITTEAGTRVVVDPFLHGSERGVRLPDSPVSLDELADVDIVAVTHAGYDHRAQAIDVTLAGKAVLVCGTALYGAALDDGVPAERCAGIVSGVTFRHGDLTLKALDARHQSTMTWRGQSVADEPMSFMLTTDAGSRIFCGGDLSISPDLRTWGELFTRPTPTAVSAEPHRLRARPPSQAVSPKLHRLRARTTSQAARFRRDRRRLRGRSCCLWFPALTTAHCGDRMTASAQASPSTAIPA
jgi:Beta-lactamase superfamily domain